MAGTPTSIPATTSAEELVSETHESTPEVGLIGTLGLNRDLFFAQLFNFAVVFFVMWRWVYKPLVKAMDERSTAIAKGLSDADAAAKALSSASTEKDQVIAEAKREAMKIVAAAEADAKVERDAAVGRAKAEIEKMVVQGKEILALEKTKMAEELRDELGNLVATAVEKVVGAKVDGKKDKELIAEALKKL